MNRIILLFFLPFLLFGESREDAYIEEFGEAFACFKIEECQRILEDWKEQSLESQEVIAGLKAAPLFATGDIQRSAVIIEPVLDRLVGDFSHKRVEAICRYYQIAFHWLEESVEEQSSNLFPYRIGVAQIIAGCLLGPFNEGSANDLIDSGASNVISAVLEVLKTQENWEDGCATQTEIRL